MGLCFCLIFFSAIRLLARRARAQALTETNALLAAALALHFADDASSGGGGGEAVRRACCALAFQDVADVRVRRCEVAGHSRTAMCHSWPAVGVLLKVSRLFSFLLHALSCSRDDPSVRR